MTIKEFIEAAIEGGWRDIYPPKPPRLAGKPKVIPCVDSYGPCWKITQSLTFDTVLKTEQILLDPEAWYAIGKIQMKDHVCIGCGMKNMWVESPSFFSEECLNCHVIDDARTFSFAYRKMTDMVQAINTGKTLEEFIATL